MNKKYFLLALLIVFLTSCGFVDTLEATNTVSLIPSNTAPPFTPTKTRWPTRTLTPTYDLSSTNTPFPTLSAPQIISQSTSVFIGTPQTSAKEPITADNIEHLSMVAQWGKGSILDVAFAPDGNSFIVSSALGVAVYNMKDLSSPPRWIPFDVPFAFEKLYFSIDGKYLLLDIEPYVAWAPKFNTDGEQKVIEIETGKSINNSSNIAWIQPPVEDTNQRYLSFQSTDGKLQFQGMFFLDGYDEEEGVYYPESTIREVYGMTTGELLYNLKDYVPNITIYDRTEPEGCDLEVFSMCGNALSDVATAPYDGAFSSSGSSFAILYEPPSLINPEYFRTLRIYNSKTGNLIRKIGSFEKPVVDFCYTPNSETILVAFYDGSIQLVDVEKNEEYFSAWHFNSPISYLEYSYNGEFLLIQRWKTLEVRRTGDGSLLGRYDSAAFATSPTENIMAIGGEDGHIRIRDIASGKNLRHLYGHTNIIYSLAFSENGQFLASSSQDCTARIWDVNTGKFLHYLDENIVNAYGFDETESRIFIYYLEFIPEIDHIIGFGSWGTVVNWDAFSGTTNFKVISDPLEFYNGMMTVNLHFPEYFVADVEGSRFSINNISYDLETGEIIGEYEPPQNLPAGCGYPGPTTADGRYLLTRGYDSGEGQICVLDSNDLSLEMTIEVIPPDARDDVAISWLYLSPDYKQLIVDTYSGIVYVYQIVP